MCVYLIRGLLLPHEVDVVPGLDGIPGHLIVPKIILTAFAHFLWVIEAANPHIDSMRNKDAIRMDQSRLER